MSLWRQAMNMNIELGFACAHEMFKILYEVPPLETEEAKMKDRSERGSGAPHGDENLARCKEVFLPTQEMNKSIELIDTHGQEVFEIFGESLSHVIGRAKMEERNDWGRNLARIKRGKSPEQWRKKVATVDSFSCKSSTIDAISLTESAAGKGKKEDEDDKKTESEKDAGETMEEAENKWLAGDGLDEEIAVETEEEETVKLDFALTNDEDMKESCGECFVKGTCLKWRKP